GRVVNTAAFSAVFPTLVQVEYAYSPAELRSKQYGRSAVAGALAAARGDGIRRAVFNTDENNKAVQVGIHPIGVRTTHRYMTSIFAACPLNRKPGRGRRARDRSSRDGRCGRWP